MARVRVICRGGICYDEPLRLRLWREFEFDSGLGLRFGLGLGNPTLTCTNLVPVICLDGDKNKGGHCSNK